MRGETSIIGVPRAPVAIISFAFFAQRFLQGFNAKLIIATGGRTTPMIEVSPPHRTPPPLETLEESWNIDSESPI